MSDSPSSTTALKSLMFLPNLLLQKSSNKASNTINKEHLLGRLELWTEGKVNALLSESIVIQKRLETSNSNNRKLEYMSKTFAYFIKTSNINRALKLLSENTDSGVLSITDKFKQQLNIKHPEASPKFNTLLLHGPINEIHEIVFDEISEDLIQKTGIRTKGAAGSSKFDTDDWRRILGSNVFGNHSIELRRSLARMTKIAMFPETEMS